MSRPSGNLGELTAQKWEDRCAGAASAATVSAIWVGSAVVGMVAGVLWFATASAYLYGLLVGSR
jgi:hypothetical protein